ncbi:MAG: peptidoglycan editing factor PgeF [Firmicutes bacterium]|nr:peptidoglycan editing factor PgeF [Bacillota bacterium]
MKTLKIGALEYTAAEGIGAIHAFTTRLGGVSEGVYESLNLRAHRGDCDENVRRNYEILATALGFSLPGLIATHQVHSDTVRVVSRADMQPLLSTWPDCDALITATPGLTLAIFTADCTPVLLWDAHSGAVGAAHAGWRGTALDIAGKTARAMCRELGCKPGDLHAAIGPNIGQCHFEVGAEVPRAMRQAYGEAAEAAIRPQGDKFYVNLKALNALSLRRAGVENIEISSECTACSSARYWSHRLTGDARGSQGALITCGVGRQEGL